MDFQGKKQLTVGGIGNLYTANKTELSRGMVRAIGEKIRDPTIADWIMPDFTTTNDKDRAVSEMSLMATMQQCFTYTFYLACGIPSVVLMGSLEACDQGLTQLHTSHATAVA
jgi:hypothetical protein